MENQNSDPQEHATQNIQHKISNNVSNSSGNQIMNSNEVDKFDSTEQSKVPFAGFFRSKNRKKAVIFILVPVALFAIAQSGPLWVAVMLLSPVLFIFILYGIILFFKKDTVTTYLQNQDTGPMENAGKNSYKHGVTMLSIGLILALLALLTILSIRRSAGYSGSEGELAAFPFMASSFVFLLIATINLLLTFARNVANKKDDSSILGKKIF